MNRCLLLPLLLCLFFFPKQQASGQDLPFAQQLVRELSSPDFHGRGYVEDGSAKAAEKLYGIFSDAGLSAFGASYKQTFNIPINILPGKLELKAGKKTLIPGTDYFVNASSPPLQGSFNVLWLDETYMTVKKMKKLSAMDLTGRAVVIDTGFKNRLHPVLEKAALLITIHDKGIYWHVSRAYKTDQQSGMQVFRSALPQKTKKVDVSIESRFEKQYPVSNVIGYIPGTVYPDSFIVFTAHYDHLGRMGAETFFPGAHDNASGTAMVADLARYYAKEENRPAYSIAFMLFAAEEAGLLGSEYYVKNPLFPLENICFLINLDMIGSGSGGIRVANGKIFTAEFEMLKEINQEKDLLKDVVAGGESKGSDHYPFYKKGVRSIFIFTTGSELKEYHTVKDVPDLPFTEYNDLFLLLNRYVEKRTSLYLP